MAVNIRERRFGVATGWDWSKAGPACLELYCASDIVSGGVSTLHLSLFQLYIQVALRE